MTRNLKIGLGAVVALALAAWLAFGFFGIQSAFTENVVSEDNPFASVDVEMAERFDDMEAQMASGDLVVAEVVETTDDQAAMPVEAAESDAATTPQIQTIATNDGELVDHAHRGEGTINAITDGVQTFLRFEDDFAIDNGPDLNVYLVRGADANGPAGTFDDDFIDLGDLKGNIGAQNYEVPAGVDLSEYDTVVIWCVRFGVAFNAANIS